MAVELKLMSFDSMMVSATGADPTTLRRPQTSIMCTLGPALWSVEMIEKLLISWIDGARFNFSQGSHKYHQESLNDLSPAMLNAYILRAFMLDTKGPKIRTEF